MAMVSSSDFLRAPERPTAIATLNRQRHLTPSCGGLTPTAERTVGPARISLESLTPRPGIREQYRHLGDMRSHSEYVWSLGWTGSGWPMVKPTRITLSGHHGSRRRM